MNGAVPQELIRGGASNNGAEEQTEERVEQASGERDAERVVDKGEEKILPDFPHNGTAEANGFGLTQRV